MTSWMKSFFRRRPPFKVGEILETPLKRCLTVYDLIFYSVGSMAGAGIYVLTGHLIQKQAGAAAFISYFIAAVSSIFTGLCYAEFATLIPKAGSVYVYTFLTLGELPAFVIGWTTISDVIVGVASISKAFSGTINDLSHRSITNWTLLNLGKLGDDSGRTIWSETFDFVALGLILIMIMITATGAKVSLTFNIVVTIAQILCLVVISTACFAYGSPKSWSAEHGGFAPNGLYGIISGATIAIFAFSGFDNIANASEEAIDPKTSIPLALLWSIIIITVLYIAASLGLAFLVPRELIDETSPFVDGFHRISVSWMVWVSAIGTLLATGAGKVTSMFIVPRMFYSIASDGLIFKSFKDVNEETQVPMKGLFFGGILAGALALLLNIQTLAEFMSLGILFSYYAIGIDIIVLRYLLTDQKEMFSFKDIGESEKPSLDLGEYSTVVSSKFSDHVKVRQTFAGWLEHYSLIKSKHIFAVMLAALTVSSISMVLLVELCIKRPNFETMITTGAISLVWITSIVYLCLFQPSINKTSYQTPLMPMAPVMTIFINSVLIARLPALTWARFGVWMFVGLIIYFAYGRSNSVANLKNEQLPLEKSNAEGQQKESYGTTGID